MNDAIWGRYHHSIALFHVREYKVSMTLIYNMIWELLLVAFAILNGLETDISVLLLTRTPYQPQAHSRSKAILTCRYARHSYSLESALHYYLNSICFFSFCEAFFHCNRIKDWEHSVILRCRYLRRVIRFNSRGLLKSTSLLQDKTIHSKNSYSVSIIRHMHAI